MKTTNSGNGNKIFPNSDTQQPSVENLNRNAKPENSENIFQIRRKDFENVTEMKHETIPLKSSPHIFSDTQVKGQYMLFNQIMKHLLCWGQCIALLPVSGYFDKNPSSLRFQIVSIRFFYSLIVLLLQTILTICYSYNLWIHSLTVSGIGNVVFYLASGVTTIAFMRTASKWPKLVQKVSVSNLAIDPSVKSKCLICLWALAIFGFVEHCLGLIANVTQVLDCYPEMGYEGYLRSKYPFITIIPTSPTSYHLITGILMQVIALISAMNWNYSDIFIICISRYLSSLFEEINKKIRWAVEKDVPPSDWRALRDIYTRAAKLVRTFDDAINEVTLVSFASSLFFICLKLYYLSNGFNSTVDAHCHYYPSGPFNGNEHAIYFLTSLVLVISRCILVVLAAGSVYSTSKYTACLLYEVPNHGYCDEVQRFIEQVHSDTIALSGHRLFYLSRDMILVVAGNIVTYELVLVQLQDTAN